MASEELEEHEEQMTWGDFEMICMEYREYDCVRARFIVYATSRVTQDSQYRIDDT